MKHHFLLPFSLALFLISILIVSACAPAVAVDESAITIRVSPTPVLTSSPSPLELPITGQLAQPTPEPPSLQARLAVITSRARISRGESDREIMQAQSADIQVNDQIEIVKLSGQSQQSHSILQFPNLMNAELLGDTTLSVADARQSVESPAEVTLDLTAGHMFVHLTEEEVVHLTVLTPHATIKAFMAGTNFDVCHTEELTCIMVKRGAVEIVADYERQIIRAGSAGVVLKNDPLSPVICAPAPTFITWEQRFRSSADAPSLQQAIEMLAQQACPEGPDGFPLNARILYQDQFSTTSQGWGQGEFGAFTAGIVSIEGEGSYQVAAQGAEKLYLAFAPIGSDYEDVNIEIKTRTQSASEGDFRYGVVFRRSGDQYYAFVVSPVTRAWYFLKNSSTGLQLLKEGGAERVHGLEGQDTLRVEASGSTFLIFINNQFIDRISDPDYASGDVGFYVQTLENPDALINFNSITIWDMPAPVFNSQQGEKCFNGVDDDEDGLIDQADSDCQHPELVVPVSTIPPPPTKEPETQPTNPPPPTNAPPTNPPPVKTDPPNTVPPPKEEPPPPTEPPAEPLPTEPPAEPPPPTEP